MSDYELKRVLITVKTYPTPASKGAEVVCTAGITDKGEWIRIFPVPFRYLAGESQFKKYQWVEVRVRKSSDTRKESYEIDADSINILSNPLPTKNDWKDRKDIVSPLESPSLCYLKKMRRKNGDTLGIVKPRVIHNFYIEKDRKDWTSKEKAKLLQYSVYDRNPLTPLEKIPYRFIYRFTCDDPDCTGHKLICTDWEISEAYRKWRKEYGDEWKWAIINRFQTDMILRYNTSFFVGTIHGYPASWIIIGLFYPPR